MLVKCHIPVKTGHTVDENSQTLKWKPEVWLEKTSSAYSSHVGKCPTAYLPCPRVRHWHAVINTTDKFLSDNLSQRKKEKKRKRTGGRQRISNIVTGWATYLFQSSSGWCNLVSWHKMLFPQGTQKTNKYTSTQHRSRWDSKPKQGVPYMPNLQDTWSSVIQLN